MHIHTTGLLAAAMICCAPMAANAQPETAVPEILERDDAGNILQSLAVPDALPDRPVGELEADSLCFEGGVYCLGLSMRDADNVALVVQDRNREKGDERATREIFLKSGIHENASVRLWQLYIKLADLQADGTPRYIFGVVASLRETYSGGGASSSKLYLYELSGVGTEYPTVRELLSTPYEGERNIRACFSEADEKKRQGACLDRYNFDARLTLSPNANGAWPTFRYTAEASAYPRTVRFEQDNSGLQLTRDDLVSSIDEQCTFTRQIRYNPFIQRYEFDAISPECGDYLIGFDG